MENTIKDIIAAQYDLKEIRARIAQYRVDMSRMMNTRDLYETAEDYIEALLDAMGEHYHNFDTVADDIDLVEYQLKNTIDDIEMEQLSKKIRGE